MRTTLTLDPDVARMLEEEVHRKRTTFKEAVNSALRRGLTRGTSRPTTKPYRVRPHVAKLRPGLDEVGLNRLVDEVEMEDRLRKLR